MHTIIKDEEMGLLLMPIPTRNPLQEDYAVSFYGESFPGTLTMFKEEGYYPHYPFHRFTFPNGPAFYHSDLEIMLEFIRDLFIFLAKEGKFPPSYPFNGLFSTIEGDAKTSRKSRAVLTLVT